MPAAMLVRKAGCDRLYVTALSTWDSPVSTISPGLLKEMSVSDGIRNGLVEWTLEWNDLLTLGPLGV